MSEMSTVSISIRRRPLALSATHVSKLSTACKRPSLWTWLQTVDDYDSWATSAEALDLAISFEASYKQQMGENEEAGSTTRPEGWGWIIRALSTGKLPIEQKSTKSSLRGSLRQSLSRTQSGLKSAFDKLSVEVTHHKLTESFRNLKRSHGGDSDNDATTVTASVDKMFRLIPALGSSHTDDKSRHDHYFGNRLVGDKYIEEQRWPTWDDDAASVDEADLRYVVHVPMWGSVLPCPSMIPDSLHLVVCAA
ncbi:hypothetical protein QBC40DRAFT_254586 [Triangularia verruculosa]|uniref:Uncharacterized protein n=1 Tax=Triangularia verruculosa TaxID=2587418 RepID=A0AAN6XFZ1_9PEZI|nr:hypothetical protein QBC40DRAFT_254586 [Triangularia verruculosa]